MKIKTTDCTPKYARARRARPPRTEYVVVSMDTTEAHESCAEERFMVNVHGTLSSAETDFANASSSRWVGISITKVETQD